MLHYLLSSLNYEHPPPPKFRGQQKKKRSLKNLQIIKLDSATTLLIFTLCTTKYLKYLSLYIKHDHISPLFLASCLALKFTKKTAPLKKKNSWINHSEWKLANLCLTLIWLKLVKHWCFNNDQRIDILVNFVNIQTGLSQTGSDQSYWLPIIFYI